MISSCDLQICSAFAVEVTRSVSNRNVPVLAWVATPASSLIRLFGDESRGGIGDLGARIYERAQEIGCRAEDISGEVKGPIYHDMGKRMTPLPPRSFAGVQGLSWFHCQDSGTP